MLFPLATIAFLATLWLIARCAVEAMANDGAKIIAALAGRSMLANPPQSVRPVTLRYRPRPDSARRPVHARPEWRAAA